MTPTSVVRAAGAAAGATLACLWFGLLAPAPALADDGDAAALLLADQAPAAVATASNWQAFAEGAAGGDTRRDGNRARQNTRLSFDLQYDHAFAPGWRAVLADRLDLDWPPQARQQANNQNGINTLKEAYVSWQARPDTLLDLGRINLRNGVATGYDPTDYFRANAVRSVVSVDPASLKVNRQGSVMLRGQTLWDSGSASAMFSPRLADQAHNGAFDPDLGATNHQNRWLVSVSQKITDGINPQFLLYKEAAAPPQLGLNLTGLVNDSTVAYAEWSGGRSPSLLAQAFAAQGLPHADDSAFRNRLSTGLTYTTANKISLTAELEYNGGGQDQDAWDALRRGPASVYGLYRNWLQIVQEAPTKRRLFVLARWQDALINHLDLSAMSYFDAADASRLSWLEARYHWQHDELAWQWLRNSGRPLSEFGAAPQIQSWQLVLRHYF